MRRKKNGFLSLYGLNLVFVAVMIFFPVLGRSLLFLATQDTVTLTVVKLERVANRTGEGAKYMVFTPDETFENTDTLVFGKFNSSDVYGFLQEGATYEADVAGLRVPLLSWHRNIIRVQAVDQPSPLVSETSAAATASVQRFAQVQNVPSGTFNYGGSTTWAPIRGSIDLEIQKARPEFRLTYVQPEGTAPSSQSGLEMLAEGKVAFSLSSRLPSTETLQRLEAEGVRVRLVPVAESFEVIAVHPELPISQLTIDHWLAINRGEITNWREVGAIDLPIQRFDRDVNTNFLDTRSASTGNLEVFTTPSQAIRRVADTPGGFYTHTAPLLVPQCGVKVLAIVNGSGEAIAPYREPRVAPEQCPTQRNRVNIAAFESGNYPSELKNTLYVVIWENGGVEQQVGEAYANFLLSEEGQDLIEEIGYLRIQK